MPSNGFWLSRSFELLPRVEHVALTGADMQNFLELFEVEPGLLTKQLALVGCDHVQANDDLNEHLRSGAHAKLAQMKNMLCRGAKNRAAVFQNRGITADHISKSSLFRSFLAAAHGRVDHFDSIVPTAGGDFSRGGRKDRAVNRHDRSWSRAMNHTALSDNNLLRLGVIDDRDFYNVALFHDVPRRSGDPGADCSERFAGLL